MASFFCKCIGMLQEDIFSESFQFIERITVTFSEFHPGATVDI